MATTFAHTTDSSDDIEGTTSAQGSPYARGKAVVAAWEALDRGTGGGARLHRAIDDALTSARIVVGEYDPDEVDRCGVLRRQLEGSAAQLWETSLSSAEACEAREALHADWMRALAEHLPSWEDVLPFGAFPANPIGGRFEYADPVQGVRKVKIVRPLSAVATVVKVFGGSSFTVSPRTLRPDLSHPGQVASVARYVRYATEGHEPIRRDVIRSWMLSESTPTHDDRLRVARAVVEVFGG